jgi:YggT family protein
LGALIQAIELAITFATLILIADIIVHYFLDPFHPVREALDAIVNPFLNPIRRILPQTGMIDLSPIVLYFLIRLVGGLLVNLISTIA